MLRALLDNNGVDPIADTPGALEAVEAAVASGRLELLIALAAVTELGETRDEERRERLVRAARTIPIVADGAFVVGRAAVGQARIGDPDIYKKLRAGNDEHIEDALITMAALSEGAVLVTNEKRLPNKARGVGVECMTTVELLVSIGFAPQ